MKLVIMRKGKKLPEGTIRDWKGRKYKKVAGKWLPHTEGKQKKGKFEYEAVGDTIRRKLSPAEKAEEKKAIKQSEAAVESGLGTVQLHGVPKDVKGLVARGWVQASGKKKGPLYILTSTGKKKLQELSGEAIRRTEERKPVAEEPVHDEDERYGITDEIIDAASEEDLAAWESGEMSAEDFEDKVRSELHERHSSSSPIEGMLKESVDNTINELIKDAKQAAEESGESDAWRVYNEVEDVADTVMGELDDEGLIPINTEAELSDYILAYVTEKWNKG